MRDAKPICLILLNEGIPSFDEYNYIRNNIFEALPDYRVLITFQNKKEKDAIEIKVFNGENISDVEFEELKKICTTTR